MVKLNKNCFVEDENGEILKVIKSTKNFVIVEYSGGDTEKITDLKSLIKLEI